MKLNKVLIITGLVGFLFAQNGCQSNNDTQNLESEINEGIDTMALAAKEKA
jgi:hypothetical protein